MSAAAKPAASPRERPILFSAPMVLALLAGTKTQTRRLLQPQPTEHHWDRLPGYRHRLSRMHTTDGPARRTCLRTTARRPRPSRRDNATGATPGGPWRPSIFMPRGASRISLEITAEERVERLQAISEADAVAEGVERVGDRWRNYVIERESDGLARTVAAARESYMTLWDSINGDGSAASDPWVRVPTFRVATP